uniref:NTR domain-containing protein n=1 Tax=Clastoptera arizonana TaxID=38151 RepID=A0A1B6CQ58_9HEMI
MTHAFCTSDLVTRGIIRSIEAKDELEVSEVTVKITKHLRHSTLNIEESNNVDEEEWPSQLVYLHVPAHCGARRGTGEFVFMARRKLGELALTCAPRLEDWVEIVRTENLNGSAHCVLSS